MSGRGGKFNLSPELVTVIGQLAPTTTLDPSIGSFDLPVLDKYNALDHDASLSRVDFVSSGIPGDAKFDHARFAEFISQFAAMDHITILAAAVARYNRVQSSTR